MLSVNNRNILFFSLSIALHLGAFVLLFNVTATELDIPSNSEQGSLPLNISLLRKEVSSHIPPENKPTAKVEHSAKKTKPVTTKTPSKITHSASDFIETTTSMNTKKPTTKNLKSASSKSPDHVTINQILHEELSRHFYYPAIAQRRNWQGEVLIEFTVTSNGDITKIHINTSSGYKVLDNAAIDALSKINSGDKLLLALNGHNIEKSLPIVYALASR